MKDGDIERQKEREEKLFKMIEEEFPDADSIKFWDTGYDFKPHQIILKVPTLSKNTKVKNIVIVFQPEREVMMDDNNNYKNVFRASIIKAKEILSDPPQKDKILQGTIILDKDKVEFKPGPQI